MVRLEHTTASELLATGERLILLWPGRDKCAFKLPAPTMCTLRYVLIDPLDYGEKSSTASPSCVAMSRQKHKSWSDISYRSLTKINDDYLSFKRMHVMAQTIKTSFLIMESNDNVRSRGRNVMRRQVCYEGLLIA